MANANYIFNEITSNFLLHFDIKTMEYRMEYRNEIKIDILRWQCKLSEKFEVLLSMFCAKVPRNTDNFISMLYIQ